MTARAYDIDNPARRTEFPARRADGSAAALARYRIDVIGSTVEDVVASAGGWLFDRAMSGWDVNVFVTTPSDPRALQILGIKTGSPSPKRESATKWPPTQALAVGADIIDADASVREIVTATLERGLTEVTMWGDTRPAALRHRANDVEHRLSSAARAFKAHALAATTLPPGPSAPTETFCSASRWFPPYESDLLPIG
ncbi:MAG TPA: hypothetical protein VFB19_16955 [Mycobacterium sp.]|nr:hypothetical protein [Mycobacterium sp.]